MTDKPHLDVRPSIRLGFIAGAVSLIVSVIGLVKLFGERALIANVITMGQLLVFAPTALVAYQASKESSETQRGVSLLYGLVTGIACSIPLAILVVLASAVNLRPFLPNISPALIEILTFGQTPWIGALLIIGIMAVVGVLAAVFHLLPSKVRQPIFSGLLWTLTIGLFSEILVNRLREFFGTAFTKLIFSGKALHPLAALILFALIAGISTLSGRREGGLQKRIAAMPAKQQTRVRWALIGAGIVFLLIFPSILGTYLSEVMNNVGIFILMGLGLNIVVGFAGLLDLGYVAFFAIGAYSMAVLTTEGHLGIGNLNFWTAIPFCVVVAAFAGIVLGIPVLRMRGDYLAIVTLGFGEIIRILALSDLLKPVIGGAQGVLKIPKPPFFNTALIKPEQFYYVVLAGCLLAWFVSSRLSESRLGRQWRAMQEDEDVAEAVGIKLITTKLLAFGIGAAFSGLAGAFFASKLTSIFPHSFKLEISINVLSLIIIGGIGSLPGVVVGAIILVGMPELLREFAEYRLLMYGALLVVMMLARPEGFWPSPVKRREFLTAEEQQERARAEALEAGEGTS